MGEANRLWQLGEVEPYDIGKPFEPVKTPISIGPRSKNVLPLPNQLYQGDALKLMQSWPDNYFDACITDPPYNIAKKGKTGLSWAFSSHVTISDSWDQFTFNEYMDFTKKWLSEITRVTKENGNIFIFGSYHNIYLVGAMAQMMDLRIINSIIWAKPNAQPNITCRMLTESTEQAIWLCNNSKDKAKKWTFNYQEMKALNGGKQMRNFWSIPTTPAREKTHGRHPSQKPLKLIERIVLAGTNPGDLVIDCFSGSGSTALACDRLERKWIAIERDPDYCNIAHKRISEERKQRRLFKNK